jgi:RNA polymerase sigma factor (TIGR02999 family)
MLTAIDSEPHQAERSVPADGEEGSPGAGRLLTKVYEELRQLAARKMAQERPGQTLQATALVHEAWIRLGGDQQPKWENQAHFFGAAAEAMRRILIENARRRKALRHGADAEKVSLESLELAAGMPEEELLEVNEAVSRLEEHDAKVAELVKLRFFAGLALPEAARVLGLSVPTAKRRWTYARAWLFREIRRQRGE